MSYQITQVSETWWALFGWGGTTLEGSSDEWRDVAEVLASGDGQSVPVGRTGGGYRVRVLWAGGTVASLWSPRNANGPDDRLILGRSEAVAFGREILSCLRTAATTLDNGYLDALSRQADEALAQDLALTTIEPRALRALVVEARDGRAARAVLEDLEAGRS